jgi:predicted alpha/beta-fold hydrolase
MDEGKAARTGVSDASFDAPWWLRGRHAQTVAGRLLRGRTRVELTRERIDTPDGDFLDLDFTKAPRPDAPVVLLLHGLEGSARRGYALNTYAALARLGVRGVGLNFRSCSGEANRMARMYHSGETEDLRHVLDLLRARFGDVPRGAIGFSLGGNALLKYLGEEGAAARERVSAAVAVSVPYDLGAGALALEESVMGRFYTRIFLRTLVEKAEAKADVLAERCDMDRIRRARTFREFDDAATAPIHGFAGADDYYARSSSAGFLARIRVPTLLIHAEDDPFLPADALPHGAIGENPCLTTAFTPRGGHVGFVGGTPWSPRFWAEERGARFLAGRLVRESGVDTRDDPS